MVLIFLYAVLLFVILASKMISSLIFIWPGMLWNPWHLCSWLILNVIHFVRFLGWINIYILPFRQWNVGRKCWETPQNNRICESKPCHWNKNKSVHNGYRFSHLSLHPRTWFHYEYAHYKGCRYYWGTGQLVYHWKSVTVTSEIV